MNQSVSQPLVSILIPCHNSGQWVKQAIESALSQTWPSKEVVVVDDGSTDNSLAVIQSIGSRIRWEAGPNRGGNAARNRLLELANGDWLQYLDADDYLEPQKIEVQLSEGGRLDNADILFAPVVSEEWNSGIPPRRQLLPIDDPSDPWSLLASWQLPQTGGPIWRRQSILDVGGWKQDQPCCQEHELYLRLLMARKRFRYCPTAGAIYRQWSEGTVCKRNKPEVHRRRLEIELRAETWLREHNELTSARLRAINQARFETARSIWQYDRIAAVETMRTVWSSESGFMPTGNAAPFAYQFAFRLFGFNAAESMAAFRRLWK